MPFEVRKLEKKVCKECAFYRQHYSIDQRRVFRVFCGHCTQSIKTKRPTQAACEMFQPGKSQEEAFPNKEYLSKFLLEYMAKLELLPEIHDSNEKLK